MMRAEFTVTFEDGTTHDVIAALPDFFAWSKWSGQPLEDAQGTIEDVVRLMHFSQLRTGATDLGFEDWAATIVDMDRKKVDDPKATRRTPGHASGANSRRSSGSTSRAAK